MENKENQLRVIKSIKENGRKLTYTYELNNLMLYESDYCITVYFCDPTTEDFITLFTICKEI